ncbi:MAG: hypothetical protein HZA51_16945 [Planctomycetes bacterium]|nr:hypothetical protein [Planctomycetota bacterium]
MTRRIHCVLAMLIPFAAVGCAGKGTIQLVSLNMTDIDPPEAKVWKFDAQQNCWWIDSNGELNISLLHQHNSLLGALGSYHVGLSLVFDEPPAGRARNYKVGPREARATFASAMATMRFMPFTGIVSVTIGKDDVLRGSYRIWATVSNEVNVLSLLPQKSGNILLLGTFEAIKHEEQGKKLRAFVESNSPARPARKIPTTQTTKPAA